MAESSKEAAARRVNANLKRALPQVPANLTRAVNQAAKRGKPKD